MGCPAPWSRNIFDSVFLFWSAFFVQSALLLYDCAKSHFSGIWHLTLIARLGFYDFLGGYPDADEPNPVNDTADVSTTP